MSDIGHNLVAADELKLLFERIERMEEEKKGVAEDIKDIYIEAKSRGYDPKIMRQIVRLRAMDTDKRKEQQSLIEVYASAIGLDLV
jgi:uncharacterized protein (UPF0335 family)